MIRAPWAAHMDSPSDTYGCRAFLCIGPDQAILKASGVICRGRRTSRRRSNGRNAGASINIRVPVLCRSSRYASWSRMSPRCRATGRVRRPRTIEPRTRSGRLRIGCCRNWFAMSMASRRIGARRSRCSTAPGRRSQLLTAPMPKSRVSRGSSVQQFPLPQILLSNEALPLGAILEIAAVWHRNS